MLHRFCFKSIFGLLFITLTGCATITGGNKEKISVSTGKIRGAQCEIENNKGKWYLTETPGTATIYRSSNDLKINCKKYNYHGNTSIASNTRSLVYGNVILGGIIGTTIDYANGSAYEYPTDITVPMRSMA